MICLLQILKVKIVFQPTLVFLIDFPLKILLSIFYKTFYLGLFVIYLKNLPRLIWVKGKSMFLKMSTYTLIIFNARKYTLSYKYLMCLIIIR